MTKRRIYNSPADLEAAYLRRVEADTKNGFPPNMKLSDFINAWISEPKKLNQRHCGQDGFMMMRVDFDKPLAVDNYQIVRRCDYAFKIFGDRSLEQNSVRDRIKTSLSRYRKTPTHRAKIGSKLRGTKKEEDHITKAGKASGEARRGRKRGPYKKKGKVK